MLIHFFVNDTKIDVPSKKEVLTAFRNGESIEINDVTYHYESLKFKEGALNIYVKSI